MNYFKSSFSFPNIDFSKKIILKSRLSSAAYENSRRVRAKLFPVLFSCKHRSSLRISSFTVNYKNHWSVFSLVNYLYPGLLKTWCSVVPMSQSKSLQYKFPSFWHRFIVVDSDRNSDQLRSHSRQISRGKQGSY